jgi:ubiquinol-cytochrome c reductase cytochrome b subunit
LPDRCEEVRRLNETPVDEPQAEKHERHSKDYPGGEMPFFPDFALREALVALLFVSILMVIASVTKPALEPGADPSSAGYVPRPEWYFLWLFQTLKYFKGGMEPIGTFVLPTVGIALLVSVPFIDRRQRRLHPLLPKTRPVRVWPRLVAAGVILGIASLTVVAFTSATPMTPEGPQLTTVEAAGQALFGKMGCATCHSLNGAGGTRGPDLTAFGSKPNAANRVLLHFTGIGAGSGSLMPGYQLTDEELSSLAAYLLSLKGN